MRFVFFQKKPDYKKSDCRWAFGIAVRTCIFASTTLHKMFSRGHLGVNQAYSIK